MWQFILGLGLMVWPVASTLKSLEKSKAKYSKSGMDETLAEAEAWHDTFPEMITNMMGGLSKGASVKDKIIDWSIKKSYNKTSNKDNTQKTLKSIGEKIQNIKNKADKIKAPTPEQMKNFKHASAKDDGKPQSVIKNTIKQQESQHQANPLQSKGVLIGSDKSDAYKKDPFNCPEFDEFMKERKRFYGSEEEGIEPYYMNFSPYKYFKQVPNERSNEFVYNDLQRYKVEYKSKPKPAMFNQPTSNSVLVATTLFCPTPPPNEAAILAARRAVAARAAAQAQAGYSSGGGFFGWFMRQVTGLTNWGGFSGGGGAGGGYYNPISNYNGFGGGYNGGNNGGNGNYNSRDGAFRNLKFDYEGRHYNFNYFD